MIEPIDQRSGLSGYLRCVCERSDDGICRLSSKSYKTPIHIGKPYWDGNSLLLNLMTPTAGMLGGDTVELDVSVTRGAALTVSNPSSLRIHKMGRDEDARWSQRYRVTPGSFLEVNPEWLILQGESSFTQVTELDVERGGDLFFIETIAPGRIAHGEAFAFRRFRNRLSLVYDGKLVASERHQIEPERGSHRSWQLQHDSSHFFVSIYLVSARLEHADGFWSGIRRIEQGDLRCGYSRLGFGPCWNFKILAKNPIKARKTIEQIRQQFFSVIGRIPPKLRRQ